MPSSTGENRPMRVSSSTGPETRIGDFSFIDANSLLPTASGCVLSGRRQQPVFRYWDGHRRPRRETCSDSTVQVFALCSRLSFDCHGTSELFPITRQTRRGRSTKLAAPSASLRRFRRLGWPRGGRRRARICVCYADMSVLSGVGERLGDLPLVAIVVAVNGQRSLAQEAGCTSRTSNRPSSGP
jgi:hypothetical protein